LTVHQAAAGRSTLLAVVIGVALGAVVLVPSLLLLFHLFLHGRFDGATHDVTPVSNTTHSINYPSRLIGACVLGSLLFGAAATICAEGWAQVIGICCLCASAMPAFIFAAAIELPRPAEKCRTSLNKHYGRGG
jgi:cytochrome d ubiquinol oxidase subunit II